MEKENSQLETRKYEIEKLTGKSKHIVKVENHPHTKIADKLKDTVVNHLYLQKQLNNTQNN